jgi:squalene synthase HpnC
VDAPPRSTDARSPGLTDPGDYRTLALRHYENFPVGSLLLPREARRHLHRIYAFARTADDLADEHQDLAALEALQRDLLAHVDGTRADVPLFVELCATMRDCSLDVSLFTDLLSAFRQDCTKTRYDEAELRDYCRRSADPVGRLVLRVHGYRDPALDALSDRICTALQLLNHLQDLREDLRDRDRIYFPAEDLEHFGVTPEQLLAERADPAVRAFVRHQAERIAAEFAAGWPLVGAVRGRLRWELRAILRGAAAVLRRIEAEDGDVLAGRVHLGKGERLSTVLAGLCLPGSPRWQMRWRRA